ncbi:sarcosine oxidase subunit alpha [Rhodoligotrophos appendicifer]|uniref:(2Fe-2S)-binding protein n=1 Tax=Rhodoligotrophos appendicifer TaxID=987056 RepID=UPI001185A652|nr:(2Fe-2S)-binding protein [Rhodoligotrophos appendicifer]
MFRRLRDETAQPVGLFVDGLAVEGRAGDSVAAVLFTTKANTAYRVNPVSGAPRSPYCMMGACFECLVSVDGRRQQQGCLVTIAEGMRVETDFPGHERPE